MNTKPFSRRQAIRAVIGAALASASSLSLINSAVANGHDEVIITTKDGVDILISGGDRGEIVSAEQVSLTNGVTVVDHTPSGTFFLPEGQSVVFKDGVLVGGSAAERRYAWAAFALRSR
jgi:leucyl aminopeptidase (aminopeptidase T)